MALDTKKPRVINLKKAFNSLVDWLYDKAEREDAPGFVVGISGTDSNFGLFGLCASFGKTWETGTASWHSLWARLAPFRRSAGKK